LKYKSKFFEHGVDDLETILELNEHVLETQIGVTWGDRRKILNQIKKIREQLKKPDQ